METNNEKKSGENVPFVYEKAVEEVRNIIGSIEKNEIPFEKLPEAVKRADGLIKMCREALRKSEEDIMKSAE